MDPSPTRAGTVALVGLPNAGKSSLLNRLLGTKLSIVTPLAQTTRQRVVGIESSDDAQMIFVDTPGLVDPGYLLHRSLVALALEALADADVVVPVVDAMRPRPEFSPEVMEALRSARGEVVVALNKRDVAPEDRIRDAARWAGTALRGVVVPVSAVTGEGIEDLRSAIAARLPESPFLYPDDEISSQPVRFFVAELIRETIFEQYTEEVPYSAAVRVEEFREDAAPILIRATVLVERASQKGILVGRGGAAIRELGSRARAKIERFLDARVYLDLWVKVLPKWRKNPVELKRLGFPVPEEHT